MSRMALALLAALASKPTLAQGTPNPLTAEQAMINYREAFPTTRELDCPTADDAEEIVVCGRRSDAPDPNRAPLPIAREPGARIAGEPVADSGGCHRLCHQPVVVDVFKAAKFMKNLADRIIDGE